MKYADFLKETPVAHRGLHSDGIPENSVAAFLRAVEKGYAIETDVHLSKDGVPVVFHDDRLARMTGENRALKDCTAEELTALALGGTQQKIPLFSDFLSLIGGRVPLLIEIKNMPHLKTEEAVRPIAEALRNYGGVYAIQSFQPLYLPAFRRYLPEIPCGLLATARSSASDFGNSPLWRIKSFVMGKMLLAPFVKPDFISYYIGDYPLPARWNAYPRLAWVATSYEAAQKALAHADNIIFEHFLPPVKTDDLRP